jgi:uncharacterized protein (TIGR02001 family)
MGSPVMIGLLAVLFLPSAPTAHAGESLGTVYSSVSATSDYRNNGISVSDRQPAVQGSLHWRIPNGFYIGVWGSSVDFRDAHDTSAEVDAYAGRRFDLGATDVRIEGMYSYFDDHERGPTYDFMQVKVRASHTFHDLALALSGAWSPDGSYGAGTTWQVRGEMVYPISAWLKASALLGRGLFENRIDRTYWDAGATAYWRKLSFDVRYVDTNLSRRQCLAVDWCDAAIIGTLTFYLPAVELATD